MAIREDGPIRPAQTREEPIGSAGGADSLPPEIMALLMQGGGQDPRAGITQRPQMMAPPMDGQQGGLPGGGELSIEEILRILPLIEDLERGGVRPEEPDNPLSAALMGGGGSAGMMGGMGDGGMGGLY